MNQIFLMPIDFWVLFKKVSVIYYIGVLSVGTWVRNKEQLSAGNVYRYTLPKGHGLLPWQKKLLLKMRQSVGYKSMKICPPSSTLLSKNKESGRNSPFKVNAKSNRKINSYLETRQHYKYRGQNLKLKW